MTAPFFDLQVNGFAGVDFQDAQLTQAALRRAVDALLRHRTGGILLTLITDRIDSLAAKLAQIEHYRAADPVIAAMVVGYHLEGPHMSALPGYHGAHPRELMSEPDVAAFDRLQSAANGRVRLVTIAPELRGSPEYIAHVRLAGARVAIGHSAASDAEIDAAIAAGLTMCTHLGNGAPMELPRHDNIIQRLLARDELDAVFIVDGLHVPPRVLKNFVRAKPAAKVLFTTDCMAAAGAGPGRYQIGRLEIEVGADGVVREPGKPNFAGSSLTMDRAAENVAAWLGWPGHEVAAACGSRVRAALGLG
ncbi:N-acetylglucosamine-6-phosphate deacetylase [Oleiharenicola lentus]|uniref:N-acetylglucosamine-6-phosphate deacetylase n=1 Tax=Oleiharenicola lentus TaxID=2508720 RepID=UPI003F676332